MSDGALAAVAAAEAAGAEERILSDLGCLRTLFTLSAYLHYTPQLRYKNEDQIHYSRTRSVTRAPSRKPTAHRLSAPSLGHPRKPAWCLY